MKVPNFSCRWLDFISSPNSFSAIWSRLHYLRPFLGLKNGLDLEQALFMHSHRCSLRKHTQWWLQTGSSLHGIRVPRLSEAAWSLWALVYRTNIGAFGSFHSSSLLCMLVFPSTIVKFAHWSTWKTSKLEWAHFVSRKAVRNGYQCQQPY